MKKLFSLLLISGIFLLFGFSTLYSQSFQWDKSQKLTNGFVDRNPSFDTKNNYSCGTYRKAFLVFERTITAPNSDICVMKFTKDSAFTSNIKYLTSGNTINHNPKISWPNNYFYDTIEVAFVVWERTENSRVNIYGCTFYNNIWSEPFPIDTGSGIKATPQVLHNSANLFSIVYENNGDIIFKQVDAVTHAISDVFNLTASDPIQCTKPCILKSQFSPMYIVCYQRLKSNGEYAIFFQKATSIFDWTVDSVTTDGNNINPQFAASAPADRPLIFESNRTGKYKIYYWSYGYYMNYIPYLPDYNYSNYQNFLYPQITKVSSLFNSVLAKTNSGFKLMVGYYVGQISDSLLISDTLHKPVVTMGNGILDWPASLQAMVWTVFNKDSAGYSMLYAFGKKIYISSVNQIGNEMPSAYILHQNYPNPFNPSTKINFAIPKEGFVSLKIYDMLGREIKTLFNDNLKAGTYTIDFNAGLLTSGIYFYKLQSGTFTDVHKMILLK